MAEIRCPLTIAAQEHGHHPALIDRNVTLTWSQVAHEVDELAKFLVRAGVEREDRVAIVENNRIELPLVILALIRTGVTAVLLSPRYPETTLATMAENCRCRYHLFWSRGSREARIPSLKPLCLPELSKLTRAEHAERGSVDHVSLDTEQAATIIYTSGTCGEPKAALLSYGNHYYNALGSNENLPIAPGDRWLLSLPLYHVGGLGVIFRCLLGGGTIVQADSSVTVGTQNVRDRITHVSMVPTQLKRLLDDPLLKEARTKLKAILLGGSPIPTTLLSEAADSQLPVFLTYGLSETASQVATGSSAHPTEPQVLPYREVRISDNGEILVRGETLFKGYIDGDSITRSHDAEGWFHTGDLGSLNSTGHLAVLGRKDNMFISGGENIQPEQIERALTSIAGIRDALVVPVEDSEYGNRPVAFVRYNESINLSDPQSLMSESERFGFDYVSLSNELSRTLPRFMIPIAIYPWPHDYEASGIKADRRFFRKLAEKLYRPRVK